METPTAPAEAQSAVPVASPVPAPAVAEAIPAPAAPVAVQTEPVTAPLVPVPRQPAQSIPLDPSAERQSGPPGKSKGKFAQEVSTLLRAVKTANANGVQAPPEVAKAWGASTAQLNDPYANYGKHGGSPAPATEPTAEQKAEAAEYARMEQLVRDEQAALMNPPAPVAVPVVAPVVATPAPAIPAVAPPEAAQPPAPASATPAAPAEDFHKNLRVQAQSEEEAQILSNASYLQREAGRTGKTLTFLQAVQMASEQVNASKAQFAPPPVVVPDPPKAPEGPTSRDLAQQAAALELEGLTDQEEFKTDVGAKKIKQARQLQQQAQAAYEAELAYQDQLANHQQSVAQQQFVAESQQAYQLLPGLDQEASPQRKAYEAKFNVLRKGNDPRAHSPVEIVKLVALDMVRAGQTITQPAPVAPAAIAPASAQPVPVPAMQATVPVVPAAPPPQPHMAQPPRLLPPPIGAGNTPVAAPQASPLAARIASTPNSPTAYNKLLKETLRGVNGRGVVAVRG